MKLIKLIISNRKKENENFKIKFYYLTFIHASEVNVCLSSISIIDKPNYKTDNYQLLINLIYQ